MEQAQRDVRIPYKEALNASQLEAVEFDEGYILVIAGAGSGKTRTLTYRVARLVEAGVPPGAILLLTFTRKASQEMLRRAALLLDNRCEGVAGGTFHSLAYTLLRRYASRIGFDRGFAILDRADTESLIEMLRKDMDLASRHGSFPRKATLANIYSRSANKTIPIETEVADYYPHFAACLEDIDSLYHAYTQRKRELQYLDYDDLLLYLKRLLEDHPDIRERISSGYRYIMVDEYQDTNRIQADIIYLLSDVNQNVMAVGDDSQSIYAFRGASFENIMMFPEIFPGTKVVRLEENYRSVQPILNVTNEIISKAREKYSKRLFTNRQGGSKPLLVEAGSENSQSRYVVDRILELSQNGVPLHQMAVLFRAGFHSFDLEIELGREGIDFVKYGGFRFMESAHIKDVLAYLRVLVNPQDRISWHRVLLLLDKVGPKTAESIYRTVLNEKAGYTGILAVKPRSAWAEGMAGLKELFSTIDSHPMSVAETGEAVLEYYSDHLREKFDDHPRRLRDLEHLLTIMRRYDGLEQFLTDMTLEPPSTSTGTNLTADRPDTDQLILSTVHSAKGLEWHTVFVIWTLDGRFPSVRALDREDELEEELRLLYVAATRAKENLAFVYPSDVYDRATGMIFDRPSRFLDEIPSEILDRIYVEDPW